MAKLSVIPAALTVVVEGVSAPRLICADAVVEDALVLTKKCVRGVVVVLQAADDAGKEATTALAPTAAASFAGVGDVVQPAAVLMLVERA